MVIENWIATYHKKSQSDRWRKDMDQLQHLITTSEVKRLNDSNMVTSCIKTLKAVPLGINPPSFKQFTTVRDYLLMYICLNNASRTGTIANMTGNEFSNAQSQQGTYVRVFDHKTICTSGPAIMCFSTALYKETTIFVNIFRNKLQDIDVSLNSPIFTSWSGSKMSSSMVSGQINYFLEESSWQYREPTTAECYSDS